MSWNVVLLINAISSLFLGMVVFSNKRTFFSFYNFFLIWYWLVMFFGVPISYFLATNFGFSRVGSASIGEAQLYSIGFILLFIFAYKMSEESYWIGEINWSVILEMKGSLKVVV